MDLNRLKELSAAGLPVALAPEQMLELLNRLELAETLIGNLRVDAGTGENIREFTFGLLLKWDMPKSKTSESEALRVNLKIATEQVNALKEYAEKLGVYKYQVKRYQRIVRDYKRGKITQDELSAILVNI